MAISLDTTPPDPTAGATGHFAHHIWLKDSVLSLAANAVPLESHTPPEVDVAAMSAGDLKTIAEALLALGIIAQST